MRLSELHIRDPFIFPDPKTRSYYLFGTTGVIDQTIGFDYYRSGDMQNWEGPFPLVRREGALASIEFFWGVEIVFYKSRYYLFTTLKGGPGTFRGCWILESDSLTGPYTDAAGKALSPPDWECLDGGLYIDQAGDPWLVFCHEWWQVHNGTICATKLSADLRRTVGRPVFLFSGSEGPWSAQLPRITAMAEREQGSKLRFPVYITDAPFLYRTKTGMLLMLWSSFSPKGYCIACAESDDGEITGNWRQQRQLLFEEDGGHPHIFTGFDNKLYITFHVPNHAPLERAVIFEVEDLGNTLRIKR